MCTNHGTREGMFSFNLSPSVSITRIDCFGVMSKNRDATPRFVFVTTFTKYVDPLQSLRSILLYIPF